MKFKADFHHMHIWAKKDLVEVWYEFPYIVTEDYVAWIIRAWPSDWLTQPTKGAETEPTDMSSLKTSAQIWNKDTKKQPKHVTFATAKESEK